MNKSWMILSLWILRYVNRTFNLKARFQMSKTLIQSHQNIFTKFSCSLTKFNISSLLRKFKINWWNNQVFLMNFIKDNNCLNLFLLSSFKVSQSNPLALSPKLIKQTTIRPLQEAHLMETVQKTNKDLYK